MASKITKTGITNDKIIWQLAWQWLSDRDGGGHSITGTSIIKRCVPDPISCLI